MLSVGTRLGPYEILSPLGAGGMGEVFKAKDTRLNRTVAIKILPAHLAGDPAAKARFDREAKSVAALNHPHICTLHDVGHADDTDFLVMEFVDGETLANRLKRGPMSLEETLDVGSAIADALDRAHRAGIIHRDLKPSNIMLTKAGTKVLDFGIATMSAQPVRGFTTAETVAPLTGEGTIVGTLPYMSPEQLEDRNPDHRADIWALGCVLSEMVLGEQTFQAPTQAGLIAAILNDTPGDLPALRGLVLRSPAFARVVRTCLAKDPDDRFQTCHDLGLQLRWLRQGELGVAAVPSRTPWRSSALPLVVGLIAGTVFTALAIWTAKDAASDTPVQRLAASLPTGVEYVEEYGGVAVSRDGTRLVFAGQSAGKRMLYQRALDQLEAQPIAGTEDGYAPFFSADGQWVGFFASPGPNGSLRKVPVGGGPAVSLCHVRFGFGGSWSADGTIFFAGTFDVGDALGGLRVGRIPASGGTPSALTTPEQQKEEGHGWPELLPDGKTVLFSVQTGRTYAEGARIAALSLESGTYHTIVDSGYKPRYLPSGHIAYIQNGALMAVPFDVGSLKVTGAPTTLVEAISGRSLRGEASFDISPSGVLVYVPGPTESGTAQRTLVWVDREGREEPLPVPANAYVVARLSPDGSRLALDVRGWDGGIRVWEFGRRTLTRLLGQTMFPVWTPDSRRLLFVDRGGAFLRAADGSGQPELVLQHETPGLIADAVSADAKYAVLREFTPKTRWDQLLVKLDGDRRPTPLIATQYQDLNADISPDGRWLAYESNESGEPQVYVRPFPAVDSARWLISTDGGTRPVWSRDGRELFYWSEPASSSAASVPRDERTNSGSMMTVSVSTQGGFNPGVPKALFSGRYYMLVFTRSYDVSADGRRFLAIKDVERAAPTDSKPLIVVLNVLGELQPLATR